MIFKSFIFSLKITMERSKINSNNNEIPNKTINCISLKSCTFTRPNFLNF
ncbi:hypothetical protein DDB_G0276669 [Dictyostelium discoideum AX4]|uniref:Uncharacterized protein n=1 Tax=Dictyostelium discoideum TaxID=44689 RepID=Q551B7_DICDI|nr:hypothetical protein DDB_G0276669 [Dictyostelium discoideum AX4]EAL69092.1 hypothetical protein DDB_G0276669 [Dictyostelium discoideum AX4]|eukprot:XP_643021.1 hypothetical protein DDB_G0276669 [Dictyostelium discoideum AX4]